MRLGRDPVTVGVAAAIAIGAAATYAFLARPLLSDVVPRWLGWEHGALTLVGVTFITAMLTRDPGKGPDAPARGRRHEQSRAACVDPAFADASRVYGRYVDEGRDRALAAERLTDTLVALGADVEDARRLVDDALPAARALKLPHQARDARARGVEAVLDVANAVSREPALARDLERVLPARLRDVAHARRDDPHGPDDRTDDGGSPT